MTFTKKINDRKVNFEFNKEFIDGVEVGGAATFLEFATDSDIQLFI